ncbi:MAG: DUF2309 domain-containing protein [Bacteroidia bacterium]
MIAHTSESEHGLAEKLGEHAFDVEEVLHLLKHYLPAQAPLKDFIHHNTLHAFQNQKFFEGLRHASEIFGYKVSMQLDEYRQRYESGEINPQILDKVIRRNGEGGSLEDWRVKLLKKDYDAYPLPLVGRLRSVWKTAYHLDFDALVHPLLFRLVCSYLDQGVSMWDFPVSQNGLFRSCQELERNSFASFFKSKRARKLLTEDKCSMIELLQILVGQDESLYQQYLFDLAFSHQGWAGLVAQVEDHPETLLDFKPITLHDLLVMELLLEIDALEYEYGARWKPLELSVKPEHRIDLFGERQVSELSRVMNMWQEAFEWSYYDSILGAMRIEEIAHRKGPEKVRFQAMFCIDDRECSLRRHIEHEAPDCETFGTAGFFGVEFYFQPEGGKFYTKLCPAPVTPKYLIKEVGSNAKRKKDLHLSKRSHGMGQGWIISQTLGFWSALRLFVNVTRPTVGPAMSNAFQHHDKQSALTIENADLNDTQDSLQIGFTITEMVNRVEALLRSIGLVDNFAPLVYVLGHGSSSINNPHYAAYDCGACSGRPGSVNARVLSFMANHAAVREHLAERGILIPSTTRFIGALHDTCRDEVEFFDVSLLSTVNARLHAENVDMFERALHANAKERSRRLELVNSHRDAASVHDRIKLRSISLFEPRPELNHATNALCVVGRRTLTRNLFLDRRSFLNSYDYEKDPEGKYLFGILKAVAPVCGGINLEYFFSRVDNQKLGAGSKLPHNVMGLFGVANGTDGDLRPGLPSQMIEVHDPVRLLVMVEHHPSVVLKTIQQHPETYEWFANEWVHLVVIEPTDGSLHHFRDGHFEIYEPLCKDIRVNDSPAQVIENESDNIDVFQLH